MNAAVTKKHERGQGVVEYALILILVAVVVVCIVAMIGIASTSPEDQAAAEFAERDQRVAACVESERYTREECVVLMGQPDQHTTNFTYTIPMPQVNGGR